MALIDREKHAAILRKFKEEIRRNPDANLTPYIEELAAEFAKREKRFISTLLLELYAQDTQTLRRDLARIKTLGTETVLNGAKAASPQREALLWHLCDALSLHTKRELSDIAALCAKHEET